MSQPRRRRRRRRGGRSAAGDADAPQAAALPEPTQTGAERVRASDARRRRRRRRGAPKAVEASSPKSSEDIFRTARPKPDVVGAPHDGRTLEVVVGELQSIWGVPQHPQEYRLTLKVPEDRELGGERVAAVEEVREDPRPEDEQRRREKAPAAPRIGASPGEASASQGTPPTRRKRPRRRRRRGGGSST